MFSFGRNCLKYCSSYFKRNSSNENQYLRNYFSHEFSKLFMLNDPIGKNSHELQKVNPFLFQITANHTQFPVLSAHICFNSHYYSTKAPSRSYRKRVRNRFLKSCKPTLDQEQFQLAQSKLPPRFTSEELCNVIALQDNPLVCLELFHWASQHPRFRHDVSTFHVTIKKLGDAKLYPEMDDVVNQLLAVPSIGSEMGVVYSCQPNSLTYDYLIHGLCAQGRTDNAKELCHEMKTKDFIPNNKSYNSLVNSLALGGEIDEAVDYLWEMTEKQRSVDFITYRTVLDEICRRGRVQEAMKFLQELQEKDLIDGHTYRKLLYVLEDDYGNSAKKIDSDPALISPGNSW